MKSIALSRSGDTYTNDTGTPLEVTVGGSTSVVADGGTFVATDAQDIVIGPDPSTSYSGGSPITDHGTMLDGLEIDLPSASLVLWEPGDYEGEWTRSDDTVVDLGPNKLRSSVPTGLFQTAAAAALPVINQASLPDGSNTLAYSRTLTLTDGGVPATPTAWSVIAGSLPDGITLTDNGSTADIAGTPNVPGGTGVFTFTIQYERSDGDTVSQEYTVEILPSGTMSIATTALPNADVDTTYCRRLDTLNAGVPATVDPWTITAGSLPPGIALSGSTRWYPMGILYGVPTSTGSYSFTVQYEREDGQTATQAYTMDVVAVTPASPVVDDSFESGDLLYTNGLGWKWGNIGNQQFGPQCTISTENPRTGTYSLRFHAAAKGPFVPGAGSANHNHMEQRFQFCDDPADAPNEMWLEWYVFIPANYRHREAFPLNNKWCWMWAEDYSGDDDGQWGLEAMRTSDDESFAQFKGFGGDASIGGSEAVSQQQTVAGPLIRPEDHGNWVQYRVHVKLGDAVEDGAIYKCWRDGVLVGEMPAYWVAAENEGFDYIRRGYYMGYVNTGYEEATTFYLDDVKWWVDNPGWGY